MDQYIAKTYTGLETVLRDELAELGAKNLKIHKRGVTFTGTPRIMYRANLECRTALRILQEIHTFSLSEAQSVYEAASEVPWENWIRTDQTFAIDTDVFSEYFDNTMYAGLLCKDAIADRIRSVRGERPSVDRKKPDIEIQLHIRDQKGSILLSSSGGSLHIRAYKKYPGHAPVSEVLAAGLIQLAGWDKEQAFINPMCGSGTFLIEAHKYARNVPSQIHRKFFAFKNWPGFDEERWELIRKGALMRVNRDSPEIIGFDSNPKAVMGAKKNTAAAGSFRGIQIYNHDFFKYEPSAEKATVIINPPYDVRLRLNDQKRFYNRISKMLYRHYRQYDNWILCPKEISLKSAGFRIEKEYTVFNGPIECRFAKLDFGQNRISGKRKEVSQIKDGRQKSKKRSHRPGPRKAASKPPGRPVQKQNRNKPHPEKGDRKEKE